MCGWAEGERIRQTWPDRKTVQLKRTISVRYEGSELSSTFSRAQMLSRSSIRGHRPGKILQDVRGAGLSRLKREEDRDETRGTRRRRERREGR